MSNIGKTLVWNDIRVLDMIIELAESYGLKGHPFSDTLLRLREKYAEDLIDETKDAD